MSKDWGSLSLTIHEDQNSANNHMSEFMFINPVKNWILDIVSDYNISECLQDIW